MSWHITFNKPKLTIVKTPPELFSVVRGLTDKDNVQMDIPMDVSMWVLRNADRRLRKHAHDRLDEILDALIKEAKR